MVGAGGKSGTTRKFKTAGKESSAEKGLEMRRRRQANEMISLLSFCVIAIQKSFKKKFCFFFSERQIYREKER